MNWQKAAAYTYIAICIFDFMIVPMWIGVIRAQIDPMMLLAGLETLPGGTQIALIQAFTFQHSPYTLQNGGLFHMAFGAILTGTTIFSNKS